MPCTTKLGWTCYCPLSTSPHHQEDTLFQSPHLHQSRGYNWESNWETGVQEWIYFSFPQAGLLTEVEYVLRMKEESAGGNSCYLQQDAYV